MLTLKQVCERSGLSMVYVRRCVAQGKLSTTKVEIAKNTFRHEVDEKDYENFVKTRGHNGRADGKSKFILYTKVEDLEKILALVKSGELDVEVNKPKQYKKA